MKYVSNAEVRALNNGRTQVQRSGELAVSNAASPFGCCNFFDSCADEIMSLYYRPQSLRLLDYMGFNVSQDCLRALEFISYVRPEQTGGACTDGDISDPCADPHGIEWGGCTLTLEDFGRYGREAPVRDLFKPTRYCKLRPRYMLDGSPVTSETLWDMTFAMDVALQDIRRDLILGTNGVGGQFDGLQQWVNTGLGDGSPNCAMLDSYVVNWNGNGMAGGAGITVNGVAAAAVFDMVQYLLDLYRNIRQRIMWSPLLSNQPRTVGDTIIVAPSFMIRCLLDFYTCWSVCPGQQYEEFNSDDILKMREFRTQLNGGIFGDGRIFLDGHEIPLLAYDWGLINGPTTGDMYMLTGFVGNQRIWEGEHLDANVVLQEIASGGGDAMSGGYSVHDGGRWLAKQDFDNTCSQIKLWMRPRIWCSAPWAQVRFQDVVCNTPTGPLSPDPCDTSFYPMTSFSAAECP